MSDDAEKVERGVGPRLSTAFAEQNGDPSPGLHILLPGQHAASKQGRDEVNQDQIWSQVQEELRFQLAKRPYDM